MGETARPHLSAGCPPRIVEKHNLSDRAIEQRQEFRGKARTPMICLVSKNGMFAARRDSRSA